MSRVRDIDEWIKAYRYAKKIHVSLTETNIIISSITGIPREHLLIHRDIILSDSDVRKIKSAIKKRINHYPLQYIIGSVEFMGINFLITQGVLIPRPETELLVETALQYISRHKCKTILDLCCGSGVVGLSIASIDRNTFVSLSDSSIKAINLTKKNSSRLGLTNKIKLYRGDLFSKIPLSQKFDLIVSNPPYVPHTRIRHLQKEVLYEPIKAIDGGEKGLAVITNIIRQADKFLNDNGILIIEHDDTHKKYLETRYKRVNPSKLKYIKTINDLSGLPRISIFSHR